jgi:2-dehydropantoate 2-reductase
MRVLIYGAGAVGCYIGGHLALAGHNVTLLGRDPLARAVAEHGLTLRLMGRAPILYAVEASTNLDDALERSGPFDWIAFTMKAYDTAAAALELQQRLPTPPPIACFQNGIGNEEALRSVFGAERVVAGTLTTPVSMQVVGTVIEERRRGVVVASDSPAAALVETALRQTTLTVRTVSSADSLKWSKLVMNMVANAVPAILDMLPGEVFDDPELFAVEHMALQEALWVMQQKQIRPVNLPGAPARTLAMLVRAVPPGLLRLLLKQQAARGRGSKLPSLLAALRAGQRRTEVAWLNGAVVQAADSLKRIAPVNHALALTVSDIAAGRAPWAVYRRTPSMLLSSIRIAQGAAEQPGYGEKKRYGK